MENHQNIIFSGCSFTWGQSLYYCNESFTDLKEPINSCYDHKDTEFPSKEHKQYMIESRFATQVANHFNCEPIVREENGGNNIQICRFVLNKLNSKTKFVVIQTTSFGRTNADGWEGCETLEEQIDLFLKCTNLCIDKNIPIVFLHFDWHENLIDEIPKVIKDRTILFDGENSFYNKIRNDDRLQMTSVYKKRYNKDIIDEHFNHEGHHYISDKIINFFEK